MAITLSAAANTASINAACDAIVDLVDVSGPGTIQLQTAADAEVATLTFSNPAFGAAAAGTATANAITNDSSATGSASPVTKFRVFDGAATEIWNGTVTEVSGGGDIEISDGTVDGNVIIDAGAIVSLTSITFSVSYV